MPMLARTAVSLLSVVTHQATRHGRPGFHRCNPAVRPGTSHTASQARHTGSIPTATSPALNVKPRLYYLGEDKAAECSEMIREFAERAQGTRALATDQLMNAIFIVTRQVKPDSEERTRVVDLLQKRLEADQT